MQPQKHSPRVTIAARPRGGFALVQMRALDGRVPTCDCAYSSPNLVRIEASVALGSADLIHHRTPDRARASFRWRNACVCSGQIQREVKLKVTFRGSGDNLHVAGLHPECDE